MTQYEFIRCADIEATAQAQIDNIRAHKKIAAFAIMPDCHAGNGVPIGSVLACDGVVIPNAVGVDIGCGMASQCTNIKISRMEDKALRREVLNALKREIPVGEGNSNADVMVSSDAQAFLVKLAEGLVMPRTEKQKALDEKNLCSLGGGNHFIEIQATPDDYANIMIHSGSRNLGHRICSHYAQQAKDLCTNYDAPVPEGSDLEYLSLNDVYGQNYVKDMGLALEYAAWNRQEIMARVRKVLNTLFLDVSYRAYIACHHNYAEFLNVLGKRYFVHRKGATSARKGELGIIPGSMGTASYLVTGLGNTQALFSSSHGAGRAMSRTKAALELTPDVCDAAMGDIVYDRWGTNARLTKKHGETVYDLGEAPQAYKAIDEVMAQQADIVAITSKMLPLISVKR